MIVVKVVKMAAAITIVSDFELYCTNTRKGVLLFPSFPLIFFTSALNRKFLQDPTAGRHFKRFFL
jgi:hypothetical protein